MKMERQARTRLGHAKAFSLLTKDDETLLEDDRWGQFSALGDRSGSDVEDELARDKSAVIETRNDEDLNWSEGNRERRVGFTREEGDWRELSKGSQSDLVPANENENKACWGWGENRKDCCVSFFLSLFLMLLSLLLFFFFYAPSSTLLLLPDSCFPPPPFCLSQSVFHTLCTKY